MDELCRLNPIPGASNAAQLEPIPEQERVAAPCYYQIMNPKVNQYFQAYDPITKEWLLVCITNVNGTTITIHWNVCTIFLKFSFETVLGLGRRF